MANNGIEKVKIEEFCELFSHYSSGQWLYPGVFKRKLKISIDIIYIILNELEKMNLVSSFFEVNCCECKRTLGEVYKNFLEIPDVIFCDNCKKEINTKANMYLIYKVL